MADTSMEILDQNTAPQALAAQVMQNKLKSTIALKATSGLLQAPPSAPIEDAQETEPVEPLAAPEPVSKAKSAGVVSGALNQIYKASDFALPK